MGIRDTCQMCGRMIGTWNDFQATDKLWKGCGLGDRDIVCIYCFDEIVHDKFDRHLDVQDLVDAPINEKIRIGYELSEGGDLLSSLSEKD